MEQIKKAIKRNQWRFYTKINARLEVEARFVMKGIENMLVSQKQKGFSKNKNSVASIIDQDRYLKGKTLDAALENLATTTTDEDPLLTDVKTNCLKTIERLKKIDKEKRFFSLETVNFFKGKLTVDKFIETLLLRTNSEPLKSAAYKLIQNFSQFYKAIDDFNQTHIRKKELALVHKFRNELGRLLYKSLTDQSQIELRKRRGAESESPAQLLRDAIWEFREDRFKKMIRDDDHGIIKAIADYLVFLQSDKLLPVFGKARYRYYVSFLGNMVEAKQAPLNKIIAGCLLKNNQYRPSPEIIRILEKNDITDKTLRLVISYFFKLTPSTLDKTIQNIGTIFETIERDAGKPDYLMNIHYLSEERGAPRQIEKIFLDLVRTGLLDLNILKIRDLHERISGINVSHSQSKGEVIKRLFKPGRSAADKQIDQIESFEDLLLISENHLIDITGSYMDLFGPESVLILLIQTSPQELKKKIISALSPSNAKKIYTALSMCLNCRYLNEHMIYEKEQFRENLETLFLSSEEPLFCGYPRRSSGDKCLHKPIINGYRKAILKQANQYLNDRGINVKTMIN